MTAKFQLVIDCADPVPLAGFWVAALGYEFEPPPDGYDNWDDYWRAVGVSEDELGLGLDRIVDPAGRGPRIWFQVVPEKKTLKNRLHLDITVSGGRANPIETRRRLVDAEAQITAADTAILTIVEILGLVVVAIMLMGLVSALRMGVIERTWEVGILRCLGARARQIRRVFSAEAVVLAAVGWAFGVLLGWLMYQGLLALVLHNVDITLPEDFPLAIPLITLAGVVVLTLIVIRGPLRRATRIQPGTALRYQ